MRLLVLDGSRVLPLLIERLVPGDVVVETATSFDDATRVLEQRPPDAVIVNVAPVDLPWEALQELCRAQEPPIPVLYESCVYDTADDAGLENDGLSDPFLAKPYSIQELRDQLHRLLEAARRGTRAIDEAKGDTFH